MNVLTPIVGRIPADLTARDQWVCWKVEERDGKPTKVPYDARRPGSKAASDRPATWAPFPAALARYESGGYSGVGYELSGDDGVVGVDLDKCRDPETGTIEAWAWRIVQRADSYTEVSPSGTGLRIFARGTLPVGGRKKGHVEMYESGRFLTVTGHHLDATPATLEERTDQIAAIHADVFRQEESAPKKPSVFQAVPDLIERAKQARNGDAFSRLWEGDWSSYGSQSEADQALANHLAFWTNVDAHETDRLFRQSGLYRPKWDTKHFGDGRTYGDATIEKAIASVGTHITAYRNGNSSQPHGIAAPSAGSAPWPDPPAAEAFSGLAGEIVRAIEPHSEADPVALLANLLAAFGNIVGDYPYFRAEADKHCPRLFVALVGATSKGRKGSSWGQIRRLFEEVEGSWVTRTFSGLSSGEGLIHLVRDAVEVEEPVKEKGKVTGYQTVVKDPGVEDKRALIVEPELAQVLKVLSREGNTLSPIIRKAWDDGYLQSLTRNSPLKATGAHISIVGHIVDDELRRYLDSTEAGNGFANRFIWIAVRRSKALPEGGRIHEVDLSALVERLRAAVTAARFCREMKRDDAAREIWHEVYGPLSDGQPGLLGSVTSRAEAQVMRLALIYALLDQATEIRKEHLLAALALWDYSFASARYIFGDNTGDPIADRLLAALRAAGDGLTRTEINGVLGRHEKAEQIARALSTLEALGRARRVTEKTEGRPAERWVAA